MLCETRLLIGKESSSLENVVTLIRAAPRRLSQRNLLLQYKPTLNLEVNRLLHCTIGKKRWNESPALRYVRSGLVATINAFSSTRVSHAKLLSSKSPEILALLSTNKYGIFTTSSHVHI